MEGWVCAKLYWAQKTKRWIKCSFCSEKIHNYSMYSCFLFSTIINSTIPFWLELLSSTPPTAPAKWSPDSIPISQFTQHPDFSHLHILLRIHCQYAMAKTDVGILTNSLKSPMSLTFDLSTLLVSSFHPSHACFHSLNKYSLSTYDGPDFFLYSEDTSVRNNLSWNL